jgi:polysaccharide pyruvyl transferase WcaK-like protein
VSEQKATNAHSRGVALRDNARLVASRFAALRQPARIAYIGGEGSGNLGDDAMFEAAQMLFRGRTLVRFSYPRHEHRLARLNLSGTGYFVGAILGGGTLINEHFLERSRAALALGLPTISLGTGVGSTGFGMGHRAGLDGWATTLRAFDKVTVRGARSAERLAKIGIDAEIVGDLALALAQDDAMPPALRPTVALNVSQPAGTDAAGIDYDAAFSGLVDALSALLADGWRVVPVAMHVDDVAAIRTILKRCGMNREVSVARSMQDYLSLVGDSHFAIAVRLHAAVLACCAGVPPLMLSYRDKCADFMESMELADCSIDLVGASRDEVGAAVASMAQRSAALRGAMLPRARYYRSRLEIASETVLAAS